MRSPLPRPPSPHHTRYAGVYDELLSPPRRSVEPPFGARYGPRNGAPPNVYPPLGSKPLPLPMPLPNEPPPGYRGRYDGPPFEDIPPGVEPPVPGFEPSPFDKQPFGPPGAIERDRLPPPNYRDPHYRPPPYSEGSAGYRDMPIPSIQNEIPVHVGEHPRFRDNYRPGHSFRDHGPAPYRDGQPFRDPGLQAPYRDPREPNFRGGPPSFRDSYRNMPYREGGFRDNPQHNFRDNAAPFRAPSTDPRDPQSGPPYHDANYREVYRDENGPSRDARSGYRSSVRSKGGSRRNPNVDHERYRERDGRDRERPNENVPERSDKPRETDKRSGHDKNREIRDDRNREYERSRDYEKERERAMHDRTTPDKKVRVSPKRNRDVREKKRSESRGRSRDRDRERRDKKEDKIREKSSDKSREHKEKDKKIKDRKKKKREKEKEKDSDKKKKRDKKEKKDKEPVKKDVDNENNEVSKEIKKEEISKEIIKEERTTEGNENVIIKTEEQPCIVKMESDSSKTEDANKAGNDLYGDEAAEAVDKEIIQNYVKVESKEEATQSKSTDTSKEEPFDGIELQVPTDDLEADIEGNNTNKEMLAPLPELSKWEVEDENAEKNKEPGEITSPEEDEEGKVTTEVLKRAENAIFAKAINSLRPIEIKKISSDRVKLYGDEPQTKNAMGSIQITVPVTDVEQRSVEVNDRKRRHSKTPPPRLSVKDRLGGKVDDIRRPREHRVVQSTVERVKSRSKTPKRDQAPYRRVTVERDRSRKTETGRIDVQKSDRRVVAEDYKMTENYRGINPNERKRDSDKNFKEDKKSQNDEKSDSRSRGHDKSDQNKNAERERKKSTLDEANFEPDYDETVESETEPKEEVNKKRERSGSPHGPIDSKKPKFDNETIKLDLTNVKKKPETESESSSDTEYSSSSSSSDARKKKKKKKRAKKKKKRAASDSDSDSDSSSDDHKKKKKKRKHKKKSSKKKKKSKHK